MSSSAASSTTTTTSRSAAVPSGNTRSQRRTTDLSSNTQSTVNTRSHSLSRQADTQQGVEADYDNSFNTLFDYSTTTATTTTDTSTSAVAFTVPRPLRTHATPAATLNAMTPPADVIARMSVQQTRQRGRERDDGDEERRVDETSTPTTTQSNNSTMPPTTTQKVASRGEAAASNDSGGVSTSNAVKQEVVGADDTQGELRQLLSQLRAERLAIELERKALQEATKKNIDEMKQRERERHESQSSSKREMADQYSDAPVTIAPVSKQEQQTQVSVNKHEVQSKQEVKKQEAGVARQLRFDASILETPSVKKDYLSSSSKTPRPNYEVDGSGSDIDDGDDSEQEEEEETEEQELGPTESYNEWLRARSQLYEYEKHKNKYVSNQSLLNENGRMREYYRFGGVTGFVTSLYPEELRRWYTAKKQALGLDFTGEARQIRLRQFNVPRFFYSKKDSYIETANDDQNDLYVGCHALTEVGVPAALQHEPSPTPGFPTHPEEIVDSILAVKASLKWNRKEAMKQNGYVPVPDVSKQEAKQEKREVQPSKWYAVREGRRPGVYLSWAECYQQVNGYSGACYKSFATEEEATFFVLDGDPGIAGRSESSGKFYAVRVGRKPGIYSTWSECQKQTDGYPRAEFKSFRFKEEAEAYIGVRVKSEYYPDLPRLERDAPPTPSNHFKNPDAAMKVHRTQNLTRPRGEDRGAAAAVVGEMSEGEEDDQLSGERFGDARGVLGDIWEDLDRGLRSSILASRATGYMRTSDLAKKESHAISSVTKFSGNSDEAPLYFTSLCMRLGQFPFTRDQAVRIMMGTMSGAAVAWLNGELQTLHELQPESWVPALLGRFRTHYMPAGQIQRFRNRLQQTVLKGTQDSVTLSDLELHYSGFVKLLSNLRVCDRTVKDRDAVSMYLESLPYFIFQYLGERATQMENVEELHRAACGSIRATKQEKARIDAQPVDVQPRSKHQAPASAPAPSRPRLSATAQQEERAERRGVVCFHCGIAGQHLLTKCLLYLAGKPQSPAGATAYAQWANKIGYRKPYDGEQLRMFFRDHNQDGQPLTDADRERRMDFRRRAAGFHRRPPAAAATVVQDSDSLSVHMGAAASASLAANVVDFREKVKVSDREDAAELAGQEIAINEVSDETDRYANTLCVSAVVDGVPTGYVMIDSGCIKTLCRNSALDKFGLRDRVRVFPVTHMVIVSATGHKLPVIGRFMAPLRLAGVAFNDDAVFYVVDDRPGKDINCDIIVGKQTVATSHYPLLDMRREVLCSDMQADSEIKCEAAEYRDIPGGRRILVPKDKASLSAAEVAAISTSREPQRAEFQLRTTGVRPGERPRPRCN